MHAVLLKILILNKFSQLLGPLILDHAAAQEIEPPEIPNFYDDIEIELDRYPSSSDNIDEGRIPSGPTSQNSPPPPPPSSGENQAVMKILLRLLPLRHNNDTEYVYVEEELAYVDEVL